MAKPKPRPAEAPNTGAESIPPGATLKAFRRQENHRRGAPGSGAGPRHAAGEPGDGNEFSDEIDRHHDDERAPEEPDVAERAYAGLSGGAIGGTPAGGRNRGDSIHRGISPGVSQRGDSTIGAPPE